VRSRQGTRRCPKSHHTLDQPASEPAPSQQLAGTATRRYSTHRYPTVCPTITQPVREPAGALFNKPRPFRNLRHNQPAGLSTSTGGQRPARTDSAPRPRRPRPFRLALPRCSRPRPAPPPATTSRGANCPQAPAPPKLPDATGRPPRNCSPVTKWMWRKPPWSGRTRTQCGRASHCAGCLSTRKPRRRSTVPAPLRQAAARCGSATGAKRCRTCRRWSGNSKVSKAVGQ